MEQITTPIKLIEEDYQILDPTSIMAIEYRNLTEKYNLILEDYHRQIKKYKKIHNKIIERCESRQKEILIEYENKNKEYNRIQERINSLNKKIRKTHVLLKSVAEMIKKDFDRYNFCDSNPEDRMKEQIFHFRFEGPSLIRYRIICCNNPGCQKKYLFPQSLH